MFHPNPSNFKLKELVPQSYIAKYGDSAIRFMNPLLMISLQQIRNRFGRMVINSTAAQQRGLRTLDFFINQEKPKGGIINNVLYNSTLIRGVSTSSVMRLMQRCWTVP